MKEKKHYNIRDNQILKNCIEELTAFSNTLLKNGKSCHVEFGIYERDRSVLANSYLHGFIFRKQLMVKLNDAGIGITDDISGKTFEWEVDLLAAYFKAPYFQDKITGADYITVNGKPFRKDFRPSKLKVKDFGLYCELIKDFSAQKWGVVVNEPMQGKYLEMYNELKLGK